MKSVIDILKFQAADFRERATAHAREEQDFTQKAARARAQSHDFSKRASDIDAAIAKLGN